MTRPNRVFAGGGMVERNDTYVTTQPVWLAARHNGMLLNDPPTSFPRGTLSVAPSRIADTSLDCTALPSISCRMSSVRMNDPWE